MGLKEQWITIGEIFRIIKMENMAGNFNISGILALNKKLKKRKFLGLRDFEAAYIINKLLDNKKRILNVGCTWGREYFFLTSQGHECFNLDLGKRNLPNLFIGDITKKIKFKDKSFDGVVMGEIMEHLIDDTAALKEIRRVLKDDGYLVITVPFFQDYPEWHVRIHGPNSMRKLLESQGFVVKKFIKRGGLISLSKILMIPTLIFNEKIKIKYLISLSETDYKIGKLNSKLLNISKYYSGYFLVKKGLSRDFVDINRNSFTDKLDN
jgi:SAM-dependent methyltransferase